MANGKQHDERETTKVDGGVRPHCACRISLGITELGVRHIVGSGEDTDVHSERVGATIGACVRKVLEKITLPPPEGGEAEIEFPFVFSAK